MDVRKEGNHTGEFLLSEANGKLSREEATLAKTDIPLPSGQILALGAEGQYVAFDETKAAKQPAVAVLYSAVGASAGTQRATIIGRHAEVALARLTGFKEAARAGLATQGIVVR